MPSIGTLGHLINASDWSHETLLQSWMLFSQESCDWHAPKCPWKCPQGQVVGYSCSDSLIEVLQVWYQILSQVGTILSWYMLSYLCLWIQLAYCDWETNNTSCYSQLWSERGSHKQCGRLANSIVKPSTEQAQLCFPQVMLQSSQD